MAAVRKAPLQWASTQAVDWPNSRAQLRSSGDGRRTDRPLYFVSFDMGDMVGLKAFSAAGRRN
jgi:hypothetical protein